MISLYRFFLTLGASFIEKHFTIDKSLPGNDHYHSFDGKDLKQYKDKLKELKTLYGENIKSVIDIELPARENARRSLVFHQVLKKVQYLKKSTLFQKDLEQESLLMRLIKLLAKN